MTLRGVHADLIIRNIMPSDASEWEAMRRDLWPDGAEDHATEIAMFFAGSLEEPLAVLVAERPAGVIVGFAELSIRTDLPALEGKRVGYVEGVYVRPEVRHRGIARVLLRASRNWARQQGCTTFASDRADRIIIDRSY
jgi:aminoglycoside 6'-N-acetyltransferase I